VSIITKKARTRALIEVKVNQVTIMDYQNDYVPYWKVTHLDTVKEEAYWNYIFEEQPYWLQILGPNPEYSAEDHHSVQVIEEIKKT
jgi:hypothetical protein